MKGAPLPRKLLLLTILLFSLCVVSISSVAADDETALIIYFLEAGCSDCVQVSRFLDGLQEAYPDLVIDRIEIHESGAIRRLQQFVELHGLDSDDVPLVIIDERAFQNPARVDELAMQATVQTALAEGFTSPWIRLEESGIEEHQITRRLTIPAVLAAAAVDAINPCACAVLILLLGTLIGAVSLTSCSRPLRSETISAALWYLVATSFFKLLSTILCNSSGTSALYLASGSGESFTIE